MNHPIFIIYKASTHGTPNTNSFMDHISVGMLYTCYKLCLLEAVYAEGVYETMYDFDEGRDIQDHIGYMVHDAQ